jgi:hypothetical protein
MTDIKYPLGAKDRSALIASLRLYGVPLCEWAANEIEALAQERRVTADELEAIARRMRNKESG